MPIYKDGKLIAFFGDGEKSFSLTPEMIMELERKTNSAIGSVYGRFMHAQFHFIDIIEIIRLGLIGGGASPEEANILIESYAKPRPIMETMPLAFDILDLAWNGKPAEPVVAGATDDAVQTDDMAAAINDALEQVAA